MQTVDHVLRKSMTAGSSAHSSSSSAHSNSVSDLQSTSWYPSVNSAQFAGTIFHFAITLYPEMHYTSDQWIVDTRATDHITPFAYLLHNVTAFQSSLRLPNGATADITLISNVHLSSDIVLTNVLCVPTFTYNLLNVSKLLSDTKCVATFNSQCCSFRHLLGREL